MQEFKIMDTFFPRDNNDYGTWKSNRSLRPEYTATLDHILVNAPLWDGVKQCGVTDDVFQMPTDHRIVELELIDRWNTTTGNKKGGRQQKEQQQLSEEEKQKQKQTQNKARFSKLLLYYRRHESPEHTQALTEIKAAYERAVTQEKNKLSEEAMTPEALLRVLDIAMDIVIDSKWPAGVPSVPQDKPRCWYEDNDNQLRDLVHKKEHLLKKMEKISNRCNPSISSKEVQGRSEAFRKKN